MKYGSEKVEIEGEIAAMVEKISGDISVDPAGGEDGICRKLYIAAL